MDGLLWDMKRDGVGFDEGTLHVLDNVRRDREKDMAHDEGQADQMGRGKMWWKMNAQQVDFSRLDGYWRDFVERDVEAKWMQDRQADGPAE